MKYYFESWSISKLLELYHGGRLDLNPPYQRNDIWSIPAKKKLIETIKEGFPLPNFFLYLNTNGIYEMVDGQQRTRAFLGYASGLFPDLNKIWFKESDQDFLMKDYQLMVVIISDVIDHKSITDFYHKVNKFGTKLNRPEIIRSEHFDNPVQKLIEEISNSNEFKELDLFSDNKENRLLHQDFIGELLALTYYGITDKKDYVEKLYTIFKDDITDLNKLIIQFNDILFMFKNLNDYFPISETRYKQRNDFYSLFSFLIKNKTINEKTLLLMYELLIKFDPKISPSNDECFAFQNYAFNCVSQSNSKKAREERLRFFNELLLNTRNDYSEDAKNDFDNDFHEVLHYYGLKNKDLIKIDNIYLLPREKI